MIEFEKDFTKLLPKNEFAQRLDEFAVANGLTYTSLADIFVAERGLSRISIYRLRNNLTDEKFYSKRIPKMERPLESWCLAQNWSIEKIDSELNQLFPFREAKKVIINRCELPASAVKFFGLEADPFDVDRIPSDEEMFSTPELDEAADRIRDAVLYKRFICCVGAVGTGKTSLRIRVARELQASPKVHLVYPEFFDMNQVSVRAVAKAVLDEWDIRCPQDSTTAVRRIRTLLTSLDKDDHRVALVFDECHRLNDRVLTSLKNFWEMTNGGFSRLLGVVLFGQPRFVEATLRDSRFREIAERIQVIEMPPLSTGKNFSARGYLAHRIKCVGGDIDRLFEPAVVSRICAIAKTPLSLGNLTNNCLMEAFKVEETQVRASMLNLPDEPRVRDMRRVA
ncbi:MAG: AAA family ATPase [Acidobacteria bacterium]|nr:AAA family ATPase [Acidobacteriota bacterium]